MREGRLGYNCENGRYGLLSMDLWIDTGFHCGECMEVLVDDQWVRTRMEMNPALEWYLVGTPYCILQYGVAFLSKLAYNLNRNILLLSTVTERVLSTPITN